MTKNKQPQPIKSATPSKATPKIFGPKGSEEQDRILRQLAEITDSGQWMTIAQLGGNPNSTLQHVCKLDAAGKVQIGFAWSRQLRCNMVYVRLARTEK